MLEWIHISHSYKASEMHVDPKIGEDLKIGIIICYEGGQKVLKRTRIILEGSNLECLPKTLPDHL